MVICMYVWSACESVGSLVVRLNHPGFIPMPDTVLPTTRTAAGLHRCDFIAIAPRAGIVRAVTVALNVTDQSIINSAHARSGSGEWSEALVDKYGEEYTVTTNSPLKENLEFDITKTARTS